MPISIAKVIILLFANSVAYPFFIATADIIYPKAFRTQKIGIVTILIRKGPKKGTAPIIKPRPTKISVKILRTNAKKIIIFLSTP